MTWRRIRELARAAHRKEGHKNKALLNDFSNYLGELLGMETTRSNMVYVVSLGGGQDWGVGYRSVVTEQHRYFYPVGGSGGWPAPPNYIAFRYDGRLQSIHHVDAWTIFTNPREVFPAAEDKLIAPHYLLSLGPAIRPPHEVKAGVKIVRAMRVWCMIDLLLSCSTITEARDATKRRLGRTDATESDDDTLQV